MAYSTPPTLSAGQTLPATHMNLLRTAFEEVAKLPQIQAYSTANQSIANATMTVVTLQATYTINNLALAANTITITEGGLYLAVANLFWGSSGTGTRYVRFLVNGTVQWEAHATPGNAGWRYQTESYIFSPAATNTVKLEVYQDSGGSLLLQVGSKFSLAMLSRL